VSELLLLVTSDSHFNVLISIFPDITFSSHHLFCLGVALDRISLLIGFMF